jgi:SAM-dependent methyltransferase
MFNAEVSAINLIESEGHKDIDSALSRLREELPLDAFGELLMGMPDERWRQLSSVLPKMVSAAEQEQWTSRSGYALLQVTASWLRIMSYNYQKITGRSIDQATFLDFGCGWGRISRLMLYFTDPTDIFGVDPWDRSIELCHNTGLGPNFRLSERLPETLPVPEAYFSLVHAFSVFTHLSPDAAIRCLRTLRRYVRPDGLLVITARPPEFWNHFASTVEQAPVAALLEEHYSKGIAFIPHVGGGEAAGKETYGETSLTPKWLEDSLPEWKVAAVDRSIEDPFQIFIFLRPA